MLYHPLYEEINEFIIVEPWCELKPADSGMSVLNVTYYQQDLYYEKSLGV